MNMINCILCLTGMTFQNHLSQQPSKKYSKDQESINQVPHLSQAFAAWWFLPYGISQHRHYKYFKCSTKETVIPHSNKGWAYSIVVKRIAGILKREKIVYRCMAK